MVGLDDMDWILVLMAGGQEVGLDWLDIARKHHGKEILEL